MTIVARALRAALLMAVLATAPSFAQDFPNRPIRIVVPFAPGGSNDVVMRILSPALQEQLGQPVVIENRPGGGSTIGMGIVAKAPADGYTLGVANISLGSNPFVMSKMPYDAQKEFVSIGLVALVPLVVLVNPTVPARTIKELIELAKSKPGSLNYGSAGNASGPHLATALFDYQTGTKMTHIPYKSGGEAVASLLGNVTDVLFATIASSVQQINAGRVIPLGVTTSKRDPSLPNVPTVAEAGVAGFEVSDWVGLVAPTGTPPAVIERLNQAMVKALAQPSVREQLVKVGTLPVGSTPQELDAFIKKEMDTWSRVVKAANIRVD